MSAQGNDDPDALDSGVDEVALDYRDYRVDRRLAGVVVGYDYGVFCSARQFPEASVGWHCSHRRRQRPARGELARFENTSKLPSGYPPAQIDCHREK